MERVVAFRERLVAHANNVNANVTRYGPVTADVQRQIGEEVAWLSQEYGRITPVIGRLGHAMMRQFGMIVSQDVVRDAIQTPTHPEYRALAGMAVGHIDMIIGQLRAEVEDGDQDSSWESLYRNTSVVFWIGRLIALLKWLVGTARGRVVALLGTLGLAIIGGVVSGAAQAWFETVFAPSLR